MEEEWQGRRAIVDIVLSERPSFAEALAGAQAIVEGEPDALADLAQAAAVLWMALERINWAGFYLMRGGDLVLGPFQGKPACTRIRIGHGVCGTAAQLRQTLIVPDVLEFPGHIACDAASRSEIVVPVLAGGHVVAVIDVDSPEPDRFGEDERRFLEQMAALLAPHCQALCS